MSRLTGESTRGADEEHDGAQEGDAETCGKAWMSVLTFGRMGAPATHTMRNRRVVDTSSTRGPRRRVCSGYEHGKSGEG